MPEKPYLRHQRVSGLIEEQLSEILLREVEFKPGVLATIISVDVSKKLDRAKVQVSVLPQKEAEGAVMMLNKRVPYLGHLLLKKLNIYPLPQLQFIVDQGNENAAAIEKALLENQNKESNNS